MEELKMDRDTLLLMIMQYLKSNALNDTFETLQQESSISFNIVRSHEEIRKAILDGAWDTLLSLLKDVSLPAETYALIYDQIICELCETKEFDLAGYLIKQHAQELIAFDKMRYTLLLGIVKARKMPPGGLNMEKRKQKVADEVCANTVEINSASKLVDLIQLGLSKETAPRPQPPVRPQPLEPKEEEPEPIPRQIEPTRIDIMTSPYVQTVAKQKWTQEKYHLQTGKFSPDGSTVATGSADGFIEILDSGTLDLRPDLNYQKEKKFMVHEKKILCLDFSSDSKMLCTGDETGLLKIWRIADGKCLRKLAHAHDHGITCCKFMRSNSQVVSGSYGYLIRMHGLKSGSLLKEFKGHESYVTDLLLLNSESVLLSASADGTIRLWDVWSGTEKARFFPGNLQQEISINSVTPSPTKPEQFLVCNKSPVLITINRQGKQMNRYTTEKPSQGDFVAAGYSADGEWIYAAAQDLNIYIFNAEDGKLVSTLKAHSKEVVGLAHHPKEAKMITYGLDGYLFLWKS